MRRSFIQQEPTIVADQSHLQKQQTLVYITKGLASNEISAKTLDKDTLLKIREKSKEFQQNGSVTYMQAFVSSSIAWSELRERRLNEVRQRANALSLQFQKDMTGKNQTSMNRIQQHKKQEGSSFFNKYISKIIDSFKIFPQYKTVSIEEDLISSQQEEGLNSHSAIQHQQVSTSKAKSFKDKKPKKK